MFNPIKFLLICVTFWITLTHNSFAHEQEKYPTTILADYVFACMATNGQRYDILQKCSCSIDYIAERLSHNDYEKAETIMRAQQDIGQRGVFYRDTKWANDKVDKLKTLQAESTLECF